jgi:hypothetical protein
MCMKPLDVATSRSSALPCQAGGRRQSGSTPEQLPTGQQRPIRRHLVCQVSLQIVQAGTQHGPARNECNTPFSPAPVSRASGTNLGPFMSSRHGLIAATTVVNDRAAESGKTRVGGCGALAPPARREHGTWAISKQPPTGWRVDFSGVNVLWQQQPAQAGDCATLDCNTCCATTMPGGQHALTWAQIGVAATG